MREAPAPGISAPALFADALSRHQAALYAFLLGFVRDAEQARDLTQDVYCDAWRAVQRSAPPFSPAAIDDDEGRRRWLFHTAYCRAVSHLRHIQRINWQSLDASSVLQQTSAELGQFEEQIAEAHAIQQALAALPPKAVACVLLNVVHGFTTVEIATIVGISHDAAKKRLTRAKQLLRTVYLAQNPGLPEERR
ncbi:MAG: RNA polymerase sigma factor [Ktedonobacterales bacterium]